MDQTLEIIDNQTVKITLSTPIKRGDTTYQTVTLRAPVAAHLEGLSQELIKIKHTDHIQKLVSRISEPVITKKDYMQLTLDDLNTINAAIDFFSAPPSVKAEMREALAELGYITNAA